MIDSYVFQEARIYLWPYLNQASCKLAPTREGVPVSIRCTLSILSIWCLVVQSRGVFG
jgi:hypothetical protein